MTSSSVTTEPTCRILDMLKDLTRTQHCRWNGNSPLLAIMYFQSPLPVLLDSIFKLEMIGSIFKITSESHFLIKVFLYQSRENHVKLTKMTKENKSKTFETRQSPAAKLSYMHTSSKRGRFGLTMSGSAPSNLFLRHPHAPHGNSEAGLKPFLAR